MSRAGNGPVERGATELNCTTDRRAERGAALLRAMEQMTVIHTGLLPWHMCHLYGWLERIPGGTRHKMTVWKLV